MVIVAGLDLRARQDRPSGIAFFQNKNPVFVSKVYTDNEIFSLMIKYKPQIVAIDSPLSHSRGFRNVDKKMIRMGYKVLPPGWLAMKKLISRALMIRESLMKNGITVIETHPRSSLLSSGCSLEELFSHEGIDQQFITNLSKDEIDAIIAALTAYYYVIGDFISVKDVDGEIILLPRICSEKSYERY